VDVRSRSESVIQATSGSLFLSGFQPIYGFARGKFNAARLLGGDGMAVRILIADDDRTIRHLLRRILEERPGWEVCGEADNGNDAVAQTEELAPDLAIIDLAMPDKNGIEAAREIFAQYPATAMLLLTVQEVSAELARAAREAGFRGAVTKSSGSEVVIAVETLLGKGTFFAIEGSASAPN
jgi:DNA-binding NarL/FixJ family response regulator